MAARTKVICFANNKGGSGKSTTCSNVGYGLTQLGRKVLLIDGDMQLNLSLSLFDEDTVLGFAQGEKNLYGAIRRQDGLEDYIVRTPYDDLEFGKYKSNEGYLAVKRIVPSVAEYIADGHLSVDKIFARSQDAVLLGMIRAQIEQIPGVRVMSSASDNIEVVTPAADKGTALGMLCRELGTDLAHAAAIGDSENDLEMLRAVALPVAMGNAAESVKAVCARETRTNAEDGVAAAIDRILAENG